MAFPLPWTRDLSPTRGQSEVLGIILMTGLLAISMTLVGGAAITSFMDQAEGTGSVTDVSISYTENTIEVTHMGGDRIARDDVVVVVREGDTSSRFELKTDAIDTSGDGNDLFAVGEDATFRHTPAGTYTVLVVDRASDTVVGRTTFTRGAGSGPANFEVQIDNTNSPVVEGETLIVRPTIENVGGESGTQTLELSVDGQGIVDSQSHTLDSGEWTQIELEWGTASGDAGDYDVTVQSVNDSDSTTVTVRTPSNFSVTIDETNEPINESETLQVNATIENVGSDPGTQTIELEVAGQANPVDSRLVALNPGSSTLVTLEWVTGNGDDGTYDATVSSLDDSDTRSVTVQAGSVSPYFSVTIDGTNSPIEKKEDAIVNATIENTGGVAGSQTIYLNISGQTNPVDTATISLNATESTPVSLIWADGNKKNNENYTANVSSENSSDTAEIKVSPPGGGGLIADAGGPYTVSPGGQIPLDGSGSSPKGGSGSYNWTIISGGGYLNDSTTKSPTYTAESGASSGSNVTVELEVEKEGTIDTDRSNITISSGSPPNITSLSVTEKNGDQGDNKYVVNWSVEDADDDLSEIQITAFEQGNDNIIDTTSEDISNPSPVSGEWLFNPAKSQNPGYVEVKVIDSQGFHETKTKNINNP